MSGNSTRDVDLPTPAAVETVRAWIGGYFGQEELEHYAEDPSPEAVVELAEAWTVSIMDPRWGREGYLWDHVSAVLGGRDPDDRFSVRPYDTGLDFDFGV